MAISFCNEDIKFDLKGKRLISTWIKSVISKHQKKSGNICLIFVSEEKILEINKKYLEHDYYTDIITFNYNENITINGDIFLSIPTIKYNSEKFNEPFETELNRIIIHGVLHLIGFDDTTDLLKKEMTAKEDECLDLLRSLKENV